MRLATAVALAVLASSALADDLATVERTVVQVASYTECRKNFLVDCSSRIVLDDLRTTIKVVEKRGRESEERLLANLRRILKEVEARKKVQSPAPVKVRGSPATSSWNSLDDPYLVSEVSESSADPRRATWARPDTALAAKAARALFWQRIRLGR